MLVSFRTPAALLVALQVAVSLATSLRPADALGQRALEQRDQGFVNMVYWPSWGSRGLDDLDPSSVTHVMYAFAMVQANGTVKIRDPEAEVGTAAFSGDVKGKWAELFQFKKANPHVKTILSVGGYPASGEEKFFPSAASSPESRGVFVETASQLMLDGGFDGLDIDWEYPDADTAGNHAALMEGLRVKLDSLGKTHNYHYLLTLAISAAPGNHGQLLFERLNPIVDYWYVMAYDYVGSWAQPLQHLANLYPTDKAPINTVSGLASLKSKKVDMRKTVLGLPSYAAVFKGHLHLGDKKETADWIGTRSLKDLMSEPGWDVKCDEEAVACLGRNEDTDEVATLDTNRTIHLKANYAKTMGLAGTFMWDLSHDLPGQDGLYIAAAKALVSLERSNNLQKYPDSRYDNIRGNSARPSPPNVSSAVEPSSIAPSSSSTTSVATSAEDSGDGTATERTKLSDSTPAAPAPDAPTSVPAASTIVEDGPTGSASNSAASASPAAKSAENGPSGSASNSAAPSTPAAKSAENGPSGSASGSAALSAPDATSARQWSNGTTTERTTLSKPTSGAPAPSAPTFVPHGPTPNDNGRTGPASDPQAPGSPAPDSHGEDMSDYMMPAFNAVGMSRVVVSVVLVQDVVIACPDRATCAPASRVSATECAFITFASPGVKMPTTTVSVAPGAGVEPVSVEVAGRHVAVCATELGCRATGVSASPAKPEASHGVLAKPQSEAGESAHADSHSVAANGASAGNRFSAELGVEAGGAASPELDAKTAPSSKSGPRVGGGAVAPSRPGYGGNLEGSPRVGAVTGNNQSASGTDGQLKGPVRAGAAKVLAGAGPALAALFMLL